MKSPEIPKTHEQLMPPAPIQHELTRELDEQRVRLSGDIGAISLGDIAHQTAEIASKTFDGARLAFHGIAAAVRGRREQWAEDREDKMDHKDLLYDHLGLDAMGQDSGYTEQRVDRRGRPVFDAGGNPVMGEPRHESRAERFMAKRLEKKRFKKEYQEARRKFTVKAYGGETASHSLGGRTVEDTRRRHKQATKEFNAGNITARELALQKTKIEGTPAKFENSVQRKSRKRTKKAGDKLSSTVHQPILSRWRSRRRYEAQQDQAHHRRKEQVHRDKEAEIRAKHGW